MEIKYQEIEVKDLVLLVKQLLSNEARYMYYI